MKKVMTKPAVLINTKYRDAEKATFDRMMQARDANTKIIKESRGSESEVELADHSTNWRSSPNSEGTRYEPKPYMMGEGLGNCLGLEPPKHSYRTDPEVEEATPEEKARRMEEGRKKAAITRRANADKKSLMQKKEATGEILKGQRIFLCSWGYDDFEARATGLGIAIPEGVDVAKTEFGTLLLVSVIEYSEGKKLGLEAPLKDAYGREYFIPVSRREAIAKVYGPVNWARPLTNREAVQFKVSLL